MKLTFVNALKNIHWFISISLTSTEKAMAPHSSTLAWKIPWMEEPGRLQSMGSLWVGYDRSTSLSLFTFMHWRRKWQPTPVFLPGESQGRGSLVGYRLWVLTESDTTEVTSSSSSTNIKDTKIPFWIYCFNSWLSVLSAYVLKNIDFWATLETSDLVGLL